jgi:hypothetical protein
MVLDRLSILLGFFEAGVFIFKLAHVEGLDLCYELLVKHFVFKLCFFDGELLDRYLVSPFFLL